MVGSQQVQILIVENDDRESQWLRDSFEETGLIHVALMVPDGESALVALRGTDQTVPVEPSLILLDLCRDASCTEADLTGDLEILSELKSDETLRSIPVVIVTTSNAQADVLNAYSHGACSFVCKPNTEEERHKLIERFSAYWGQVAELPRANPDPDSTVSLTIEEIAAECERAGVESIDVLIVDDSEDDVVLLQEAFSDCPLINFIGTAEDGEQALRYLRQEGEFAGAPRPGLVLLDINMPLKNGFEVLMEMRADPQLSNLPVVMLTTSKQESDILRAYENGACSFIAKPVNFDTMRSVARRFTTYWTMVADLPRGGVEPANV